MFKQAAVLSEGAIQFRWNVGSDDLGSSQRNLLVAASIETPGVIFNAYHDYVQLYVENLERIPAPVEPCTEILQVQYIYNFLRFGLSWAAYLERPV